MSLLKITLDLKDSEDGVKETLWRIISRTSGFKDDIHNLKKEIPTFF